MCGDAAHQAAREKGEGSSYRRNESGARRTLTGRGKAMRSFSFFRLGLMLVCSLFALVVLTRDLAAQAPQYTITELYRTDGYSYPSGSCLNDLGQVVFPLYDGQNSRVWMYSNGAVWELGIQGVPCAINNRGQVVGATYNTTSDYAFLYDKGVIIDLAATGTERMWLPYGINNMGHIVGGLDGRKAGLWINGSITNLGTLPGGEGNGSCAFAVNDLDQVAGGSATAESTVSFFERAFLWEKGTMTNLGNLGGPTYSCAYDINNRGQVVGEASAPGFMRAFMWHNGVMTDLGTLPACGISCAQSVNDSGQVVGRSSDWGVMAEFAFLYSSGTMYDINNLIPAGSHWTISSAEDINNRGQILCSGASTYGGAWRLLLTPVPEHFLQTEADPNGSIHLLGDPTTTIKSAGCYLTSTAIVLNAWGHHVDPVSLNDYIAEPEQKSAREGPKLLLTALPAACSYGQADGQPGTPVRFNSQSFPHNATTEDILEVLRQQVERYGPVMLRVPQPKKGLGGYPANVHFIVAWRVEGNSIYIRDPDGLRSGVYTNATYTPDWDLITLDDYIRSVNDTVHSAQDRLADDLLWLAGRRYTYAEPCTPAICPDLRGVCHSPIEIVITDPSGRRVGRGYDTSLQEWIEFNEIPGSFYDRLPVNLDPDEILNVGVMDAPIEFEIGEVTLGAYRLEVFGIGDGLFTVNLGLSTFASFNPEQYIFTGEASMGTYNEFLFEVVPEPATLLLLALGGLAALRRRRR